MKNIWGPLTIRYEPTCHPDFPEIYRNDIAVEHGGYLVTNGFGITHRDDYNLLFEKMRATGIHTIAFTLHGLQDHHDLFVCQDGAFKDILLATKQLKKAGFSTTWQIFIHRIGAKDIAELNNLSLKEIGESPYLSIPYHRVSQRLWRYEDVRLTTDEVEKYQLHKIIEDPKKNCLINYQSLTAPEWLKEWRKSSDSDSFKHPFEPPSWPLQPEDQNLSIRIERDRKIYLDPLCSFPIYLGETSDKKQLIIERLEKLERSLHSDITPLDVTLSPDEQNQLHPSGYSFRYKEISKKLQLNNGI